MSRSIIGSFAKIAAISLCLLLTVSIILQANQTNQESDSGAKTAVNEKANEAMKLGNFSVSLTVKDLKASQAFYEKLGFKPFGGGANQNYVIMQNGTTNIGLFQGMFEKNILTFNPGWNSNAEPLEEFKDVRDIQATLKEKGIKPIVVADESSTGPANFVIKDPDGNSILFDQHVNKPK